MGEFAVIGMGRFGRAVVHNLFLEEQDVLAIDRDPERLASIEREASHTLCLDATDEEALAALPLERMGTVVVTIGSRATEASLLTVAVLRELRVPRIVARAFDERHGRLLRSLGANEVLNPEDAMGRRLAVQLALPGILRQIHHGAGAVAEVELPEAFAGASLAELKLLERYDVRVLALQRHGEATWQPRPEEVVASGDRAVLVGPWEALKRIAALA